MRLGKGHFPQQPDDYWRSHYNKKTHRYYYTRNYYKVPSCSEGYGCRYIKCGGDEDLEYQELARSLNAEEYLNEIAGELNEDYFNFTLDTWSECKFNLRQKRILGECIVKTYPSYRDIKIRVSYRVLAYGVTELETGCAVRYVLMHEMCHQKEMNHGYRFWRWVDLLPEARIGHAITHGGSPMPFTDGSVNYIEEYAADIGSNLLMRGERK